MQRNLRAFLSAFVLASAVGLGAGVSAAAGLDLEPAAGCALLADRGLAPRGGYRQSGEAFICRSARRNILGGGDVPHDIRFVGQGDADAVQAVRLELRVNSRHGVQRALATLADDAGVLVERATGVSLPAAARDAVLGATPGEWPVGAHVVSLRRLTAGVRLFELRFSLQ
jgi:hypothetical protein